MKVAKIDATENQELASRFGVKGYPTIKFFKAGQKDDSRYISYGFSTLLSIQRDDFIELLKKFPDDYETFC